MSLIDELKKLKSGGISKLYVNNDLILQVPSGTKNITANGNNIDVTNVKAVNVNVPISTIFKSLSNVTKVMQGTTSSGYGTFRYYQDRLYIAVIISADNQAYLHTFMNGADISKNIPSDITSYYSVSNGNYIYNGEGAKLRQVFMLY